MSAENNIPEGEGGTQPDKREAGGSGDSGEHSLPHGRGSVAESQALARMAESGQLELITAESDDVLFLGPEQLASRFTAKTVEKIELKRNYILDLISTGMPPERIASRTRTEKRVVVLLGAKYTEQIAANVPLFAAYLRQKAAKAIAVASDKLETAKVSELAMFAGIALKSAGEMEAAAAGVTEDNIVDVEQVSPELASAREFLERKKQGTKATEEGKPIQ